MQKRVLNYLIAIAVVLGLIVGVLAMSQVGVEFNNWTSALLYFLLGMLVSLIIFIFIYAYLLRKTHNTIKEISDYTTHVVKNIKKMSGTPNDYLRILEEPNYIDLKSKGELKELSDSVEIMTLTLYDTLKNSLAVSSRLHAVINSMAGIIIAIDKNKNLIMANAAAIELFGMKNYNNKYYGNYIRNTEIKRFIEEDNDFPEVNSDLDEVNYVKNTKEKELQLWDSVYVLRKTPIKSLVNSQVKIDGIVVTFNDVGNIRKLEKMRSDFVANVTHELKTPLTSIKGFVETLKNSPPDNDDELKKFLNIIEIETERLTNLIQDILSLSHIENMTTDYGIESCDINDILGSVDNVIKPIAQKRKIDIEYDKPNGNLYIYANPDRIKQLLINLISNAVEYNRDNGWVKVSIIQRAKNIIIKVEDNGLGIGKEHLERIFERFYTINKGRSRKNNGTGLGLSIVKHITMLYNGSVDVESEQGKGSIFTVSLPIIFKL